MINKLARVIVDNDGELQTSRLPNNQEIMNKINEIIDIVNKLETRQNKLEDHPVLYQNPFTSRSSR